MNNLKKSNSIISYNVNGHRPVNKTVSFEQKLRDTAQDIRSTYELPLLILLQEVLAGRNMKYLNLLRVLYHEYELILPAGFDYVTHYKSIMSVILIRRDVLESYRVIKLDEELPNRVCYVAAEIKGLGDLRILNAHVVQPQNFSHQANWYICERRRLQQHQWEKIHNELHYIRDLKVVMGGDFQESKNSPNLNKIKEDEYVISGASGSKTVRNNFFNVESCIDHIILSPSVRASLGAETEIVYDNSGVGKYSDHMLLCLCS